MVRDTILVVDDSPLDLAILREIFRSLFRVECFEESRRALTYIHHNSERICAIFVDVCLGSRAAGFQLLQQLQAAEETETLPVILGAANPRKEQVQNAVEKGAKDFLVKPVDPLAVQERVCAVVKEAWPAGTTILDCSSHAPALETEQEQESDQADLWREHWNRLLDLFFSSRGGLSPERYRVLGQMTAAIANGLRRAVPGCGLSQQDAEEIGYAAIFCDVGLLGIPDAVIDQGEEQGGSSQDLYFRHTVLGHALFSSGPGSDQPFARYAAEIAYWHHKNYDGTGYPIQDTPEPVPLSAQLVRAASRCMGYLSYFRGYPDRLDRTILSLAGDVGRIISSDLYQAIQVSREELSGCLSSLIEESETEK